MTSQVLLNAFTRVCSRANEDISWVILLELELCYFVLRKAGQIVSSQSFSGQNIDAYLGGHDAQKGLLITMRMMSAHTIGFNHGLWLATAPWRLVDAHFVYFGFSIRHDHDNHT